MCQVRQKAIFIGVSAFLSLSANANPTVDAPSVFANDTLGKVSGNQGVPAVSSTSKTLSPKGEVIISDPVPPSLDVHGYVLEEAYSGKILAQQTPDQRMAPASLTKLMTLYLAFEALNAGRIHSGDLVPVSQNAWKTGGSRMFIKVNDRVAVGALINGVIVDSGNDACVALAEYIGGTEANFVNLMNTQAGLLGMKSTHYMDCTGLPNPQHYTTPRDMALLTRAIILNFPQYYPLFAQKEFTYNHITQPNRNRLLWRDPSVDGLKTGHTDEAGYCLIASARRNDMRLIAAVLGAPTDAARAQYTENLLEYGFRFYKIHKMYAKNQVMQTIPVYLGKKKQLPVGVGDDFYVMTITGQYPQLKTEIQLETPLKAPVIKGQKVGTVILTIHNKEVAQTNLIALEDIAKGGFISRLWDHARLSLHKKEAKP
jgi:D-alanyl-D-alanine carboxypeptidase (penicillin-binding protein 5/6)